MKLINKPIFQIGLTIVLSVILLFVFFGKILLAPSNYLFGTNGDGIKNYYTALYQVQYGSGTQFNGMWYPFGEHVLYTDNMPIISGILGFIHNNIIEINHHTIGIINSLTLLSLIVAVVFIFLILRHFKVKPIFAICAALIIGFLSPQIDRFTGHYSLSMVFMIPMVLYFVLRLYSSKKPYTWGLALIISLVFLSFIHSYNLLICASVILSFAFVQLIAYYSKFELKYSLWAIAGAIIPVIVFLLFMKFTDGTTDRPENPYGFTNYNSHYLSLFFPPYDPMKAIVNNVISYKYKSSEGWAYIGLVGTFFFILMFIRKVRFLIKGRFKKAFKSQLPIPINISFWGGILVVAFSLGFPLTTFPEIVDYLPASFKQFRTLGRFAIVFYYTTTIVVAFYIYKYYRFFSLNKKPVVAFIFSFIFLLLWASEAFIHTNRKAQQIKSTAKSSVFLGTEKELSFAKAITDKGVSFNDFQAILPLPYFNVGSEELYLQRHGDDVFNTCKLSYNTGLPIATGHLSRTSLSNSYALAQMLSNKFIKKEVLELFNEKPLLLFASGNNFIPESKALIAKGKLIAEADIYRFYELPLTAFNDVTDSLTQAWKTQRDSVFTFKHESNKQTAFSDKQLNYLHIKHFDEPMNDAETFNTGYITESSVYKNNGSLVLFDGKITGSANETYTASVWTKIDAQKAAITGFFYKQLNPDSSLVEMKEILPKTIVDNQNGWVRVEHTFTLKNPNNTIKLYFDGKHTIADELMIQPANSSVFYETGNKLIYNNYFITEVTQVTLYKYVSMIIFDKWRTNYWTFIATISY